MSEAVFAGVETGGTKILARVVDAKGRVLADGRWPTTTPESALEDLTAFLAKVIPPARSLTAIGIAAFGPVVRTESSHEYGRILDTPKPGWSGSNLRAALAQRFAVPVAIDTDVNAAARAEWQKGAGRGVRSLAYVTVGTGIGGGLVVDGRPLEGALHPEIGHIRLVRRDGDDVPSVCPFHENCVEGLASGPAIARRLGANRALAATLVLSWSPERFVWGGGVMATPQLIGLLRRALSRTLAGYGVGAAVSTADFCALPALTDSGLEGALLMASSYSASTTTPGR